MLNNVNFVGIMRSEPRFVSGKGEKGRDAVYFDLDIEQWPGGPTFYMQFKTVSKNSLDLLQGMKERDVVGVSGSLKKQKVDDEGKFRWLVDVDSVNKIADGVGGGDEDDTEKAPF